MECNGGETIRIPLEYGPGDVPRLAPLAFDFLECQRYQPENDAGSAIGQCAMYRLMSMKMSYHMYSKNTVLYRLVHNDMSGHPIPGRDASLTDLPDWPPIGWR